MEHPPPVCGCKGVGTPGAHDRHLRRRQRAVPVEALGQRPAHCVLHDDCDTVVVGHQLVDAHDVRMIEAQEDLALAPEAGDERRVGTRRQTLDGDGAAAAAQLASQVHATARARRKQSPKLIAGDGVACGPHARGRHGRAPCTSSVWPSAMR